jgi:hypothetical protein
MENQKPDITFETNDLETCKIPYHFGKVFDHMIWKK